MSAEQRDAVEHLLREAPLDLEGDLEKQRPVLIEMMSAVPLPPDVRTQETTFGGVPAVSIEIDGVESGDVVLYLHGGAYVLGTALAAAGLASDLARRVGARAVSVDYRLAPEHPHPAALVDAVAAYRGLLESGVDADRICMAGESAGAGLALATLVAVKDQGLPLPLCGVLMSPWADLTLSGPSITGKADVDPALTAQGLRLRAADYAGDANPAEDLISPLFADLTGLPPLLVQAGSHEILLDDATRLAVRAAGADVAVTLDVTPGVPHVFQGFAVMLDEARAALDRAGAFVRSHLASAVRV
jgi:monoterpene epsilon-lactone hydrolase